MCRFFTSKIIDLLNIVKRVSPASGQENLGIIEEHKLYYNKSLQYNFDTVCTTINRQQDKLIVKSSHSKMCEKIFFTHFTLLFIFPLFYLILLIFTTSMYFSVSFARVVYWLQV